MVEAQKEKSLKELFRDFLYNLEEFLHKHAVADPTKMVAVYIQEPQKTTLGFISRGVISLFGKHYPFRATLDTELQTVELESDIFIFNLKIEEVRKFLDELHGGDSK
jgi:hypothetical protein